MQRVALDWGIVGEVVVEGFADEEVDGLEGTEVDDGDVVVCGETGVDEDVGAADDKVDGEYVDVGGELGEIGGLVEEIVEEDDVGDAGPEVEEVGDGDEGIDDWKTTKCTRRNLNMGFQVGEQNLMSRTAKFDRAYGR